MNESQAREIFAFAECIAGLSEKVPSHEQWNLFLLIVIKPIWKDPKKIFYRKFCESDDSAHSSGC